MTQPRTGVGQVLVGIIAPASTAAGLYVDAHVPPFHADPVKVRLSKPFQQICPPGWPAPPDQVGAAPGNEHFNKVIPSGTVMTFHANVAAALIAAGAAAKV